MNTAEEFLHKFQYQVRYRRYESFGAPYWAQNYGHHENLFFRDIVNKGYCTRHRQTHTYVDYITTELGEDLKTFHKL